MTVEELEAKVKNLEDKLQTLEDIEEIKKLQRIYGYYLDNCMWDEVVDLFSDNTEYVEINDRGVYYGKEGVRKIFKGVIGRNGPRQPWELKIHMQLQGVVNVDPGGRTANGRWRIWGLFAVAKDGVWKQFFQEGPYENEYVKEDGKWKFSKMHWYQTFTTPYEDGWLKTPTMSGTSWETAPIKPDKPPTAHHPYPSTYIVPFHYKHPVTGKVYTPPQSE